jgi:hypothetical protein
MRKLPAAVLLAAALAAPASAVTIYPHAARGYAGRTVTVRGVVDGVHDFGKVVLLYMDGRAPRNGLTVAIYPSVPVVFNDAAAMAGRTVDVTGRVVMVNGKARIEAHRPGQVVVKD